MHTNLHTYDHTLTHIPKHTRACMLSRFSRVLVSETLWTIAYQAPQSMGFSGKRARSGLPCLPPGDFPDLETEPMALMSPALTGMFFTTSATWEALKRGR